MPSSSIAHKLRYPRIVHLLLTKGRIEIYFNCTLPKGAKGELLLRLFDKNRNRKLEKSESLSLGRYLSATLCRPKEVKLNGRPLRLKLVELEESSIRGDRKKGIYSWDIHFSIKISEKLLYKIKKKSQYNLNISIPQVADREVVPIGLILIRAPGWELKATDSSYILRKSPRQEAVCMARAKGNCTFRWSVRRER